MLSTMILLLPKVSSIIFIDAPVGTGFSYSRTLQGSKITDKMHAQHCHHFMKKVKKFQLSTANNP